MSELPEYLAAWNLVVGEDWEAGREVLATGVVRGDYMAAVVRDVVEQAGSISRVTGGVLAHPVSLRTDPEYGYVMDYLDAIDHGLYQEARMGFESLWVAAVRYVQFTWPTEIDGVRITWDV